MVSQYMVLFGITYLRLDIFITWWMSIFHSTIILRHFVSQFIYRYILWHAPFSESTKPFSRLSFTFWFSCWPLRITYWGIPSFHGINESFIGFIIFWPSCRSLWVVILGHIFLPQEHRTFHKLHSLFYLVVDPYELHTGAFSPSLRSLDLLEVSLSFDLVVDPHELSYWSISLPIEFACIIILVILWFWDTWSDLLSRQFQLEFRGRTYIDRPSSYHFHVSLSRDRTYID